MIVSEQGRRALNDGAFIVIDMGKSLSKVSLWDRAGRRLDVRARPNAVGGGRLDVVGIAAWLVEALGAWSAHPVEAIVPVGHGAGAAALRDGALAFAPLDYEAAIPADVMERYRAARDPFGVTGSPALPHGLNLGAQVWWLAEQAALERTTLLPWAQYWAWYLSGVAVSEVSSLGCHTDLWVPAAATYSPLATRMGWAERFAPLAHARDVIDTLRPDIAAATGLSAQVKVLAGIHDSNAALHGARGFGDVADHEATVLSTGTWFVAMRRAKSAAPVLPEGRDCLVNVDVDARAVPSARFMGGREIEMASGGQPVDNPAEQAALLAAAAASLASGAMLLPTLAPGCGPFPDCTARWIGEPQDRRAAACLYAALIADAALDLIGARETLLVEGRFASAEVFVRALAALRPDSRVLVADGPADAAYGALRLIEPGLAPAARLRQVEPLAGDVHTYRARWQTALETTP
ncbi:carbohydrate kinase [Novosphingobium fuchskuhlense]|uniref:Carbohydrate kinase n=1 Tax=Novosphingobium fuchskuhlense TaxID=1117702 RepID=A0A117USY9_9SPHN|nr:carbohydrate kinase [Novosphingobium fuchskuhlense]KUR70268.1 carbohydrate kinase [Novosphingobium fuchskuhlense]